MATTGVLSAQPTPSGFVTPLNISPGWVMRAAAISASPARSIRSSHRQRPAGGRPSGKSSGSSTRNPTRPIGHAHRLNQPGMAAPAMSA